MKRALITGASGQDGRYLAELLLGEGYEVFGAVRRTAALDLPGAVKSLHCELDDADSIRKAVAESRPDEVYHLGGVSDLKTAYADPEATQRINYDSVGVLLEASVRANPGVRFLQASSSEIFLPSASPLNEDSPRDWHTRNPYASAKMRADRDFVAAWRVAGKAFSCSAFLFNHDSPRRSEKSALRKITRSLAGIRVGACASLSVGNVELYRDWGFAKEYAYAMWRMLQADAPEDLVLATGKLHQVREAIDIAAATLGIDLEWRGSGVDARACDPSGRAVVSVAPDLYRPNEPFPKIGDSSKALRHIGWLPLVNFADLIAMMVKADLHDLQSGQAGKDTARPVTSSAG